MANLGDLTQIPVTLRPTQAIPALGQDITVTLYNTDITNNAYVSYQRWFNPGATNSIPIRPLQSIPFTANKPLYIAGVVTGQAVVLVVPGGTTIQPSPADAAASINALGLAKDTSVNAPGYGPSTLAQQVTQQTAIPANIATTGAPLLVLPQNLTNTTATSVASGGTTTLGPFSFNQIGYEITVSCHTAAVAPTYCRVLMNWTDSNTGTVIDRQTWWIIPGSDATTNLHIVKGYGPTEGNQITISLSAYNNTVIFDQVLMNQDSRIFVRHDWRTYQLNALGGGLGSPPQDLAGMILLAAQPSTVATGAHTTNYTGLFSGKVQVWAHTSSNTTDCVTTLNAIADQTVGIVSPNIIQFTTGGDGNANIQLYIPRSQLQVVQTNNNAASKSLNVNITMTDI